MPESRRSPDAPGGRPIHAHAAETQPGTGSAFVVDAPSHGDVSAEEEGASAEVVEAAEELVKEAFRNHDPSHDFHHVNRVRLMALHLSQDVHLPSAPDRLTVELAALFHDMVDKKYLPSFLSKPESGSSGSADIDAAAAATGPIPAQIVLGPFLKEHAAVVGSQRSETICRIADHVSWSKDQARRAARRRAEKAGEPLSALDLATWEWERSCIEYQLVSDADRLDAIGSFGTWIWGCRRTRCYPNGAKETEHPLFLLTSFARNYALCRVCRGQKQPFARTPQERTGYISTPP